LKTASIRSGRAGLAADMKMSNVPPSLHVDQLEHVARAGGEESADLQRPVVLVRGGEEHAAPPLPGRSQQFGERARSAGLLHGDAPCDDGPAGQPEQDIAPVNQRQLFSHGMPPFYRSATASGKLLTGIQTRRINKVSPVWDPPGLASRSWSHEA
jgi:hypothetical protein